MPLITIYRDIYEKTKPYYVELATALERIKAGKSQQKIAEVRAALDKEKAQLLKYQLPAVLFSGTFAGERKDADIIQHSGYLVLDFDDIGEKLREKQNEIISYPFVNACWISPRNNGLKALVRIADGKQHRAHFEALKELFPLLDEQGKHKYKTTKSGEKVLLYEVDQSGANESRVCFESYDPDIYINLAATVFTKTKVIEQFEMKQTLDDKGEVFKNLLVWLSNRGDAFTSGERNNFIFKLASACCRFGMAQETAQNSILSEFSIGSTEFSQKEAGKAIASAYRSNRTKSGTAIFERGVLVDRTTRAEVKVDEDLYNPDVKPKDVIFGLDVKQDAEGVYDHGYQAVAPLGIEALDFLFKSKRGDATLLGGIGNYGKSRFKKWYQLLRALKFGEKYANFSPEEYPPHKYYHDFVEMIIGCDMTPKNPYRPPKYIYSLVYDWVSAHFFFVYPKEIAPTPDYIKERFLELIIKEKIDGWDIDPFNQLANDYGRNNGRTDQYLETFLADFARFTQNNNGFGWIVAHPTKLSKGGANDLPCPGIMDIAGGAMWNNKMDNILMYHRPFKQSIPTDTTCQFHSLKIRDQESVGLPGNFDFQYSRSKRRFFIDEIDHMQLFVENCADLAFLKDKIIPTQEGETYANMPTSTSYSGQNFSQNNLPF